MPEPRDDTRDVATVITRTHREEWARIVAGLTRRFGDLDLAEEMTAEAFATAVEHWPAHGIPPNPAGWVTTTANRRAIDRRDVRRAETRSTGRRCDCTIRSPPARPAPSRMIGFGCCSSAAIRRSRSTHAWR